MAAYEVMLATPAIRNLIREGKSFQIQSMIQTSKKLGMQAMDDAIYDLYMQNKISAEDAVSFAQEPAVMQQKVTLFKTAEHLQETVNSSFRGYRRMRKMVNKFEI